MYASFIHYETFSFALGLSFFNLDSFMVYIFVLVYDNPVTFSGGTIFTMTKNIAAP